MSVSVTPNPAVNTDAPPAMFVPTGHRPNLVGGAPVTSIVEAVEEVVLVETPLP